MYAATAGWGGVGAIVGAIHNNNVAANMIFTDCYANVEMTVDIPGQNTTRAGAITGSYLGNNTGSVIAFVRCDAGNTSINFPTDTGNTRVGAMMGCMQNAASSVTVIGCIWTGFHIVGNNYANNSSAAAYGVIGYHTAAKDFTAFAHYGELYSGWGFSSAADVTANTGVLAIGAATADGKTTVTILKDTVDFLNKKYADNWSVAYNGASIAGTAGVANDAGDLSFTFDAVEGKSATVVMGGLNYNLKGDEKMSTLITDRAFAGGTGTAADPYKVSTPEQLFHLARTVIDGKNYDGEYVVITNDIDMADYPWTMHFDNSKPFCGTLDGQGYTIDNFNIVGIAGNNAGLFSVAYGATFKNLNINSPASTVYVKATPQIGILVGSVDHTATINRTSSFTDININANIHVLAGNGNGNNIAGVVGQVTNNYQAGKSSVLFQNVNATANITGGIANPPLVSVVSSV